MRVLVTGAGGRSAASWSRRWRAHEVIGRRPRRRSTSPTATPCSPRSRSTRPTPSCTARPGPPSTRAKSDPDGAFLVNALGGRYIAEAARRVGAHVVHVSTDYVFDGTKPEPYVEWDTPEPAVGLRALQAGGRARARPRCRHRAHLVGVRPPRRQHGEDRSCAWPASDEPLRFVDDQRGHPTFAADLAAMLRRSWSSGAPGTFHVTNQGAVSWFEFAREVLARRGRRPRPGRADRHRRPPAAPPRAPPRQLGARQPRPAPVRPCVLHDFRESLAGASCVPSAEYYSLFFFFFFFGPHDGLEHFSAPD